MSAPLSLAEVEALFADLTRARGLALAVSGGADSVALMLAAARFVDKREGAPRLHVMTVDHGLRSEAAAECVCVAAWAQALGLPVSILKRDAPLPAANLQAEARELRYGLLVDAAREHDCDHVLTAHTRDDQAETFLMRLARGSGLKGLAAMMRTSQLAGDLTLVRPFLDVPKARLIATCRAARHSWIEDPSNVNDRFSRARLRRLMPGLAAEGLTAERLAETAARLARAQEVIDAAVNDLLSSVFRFDEAGYGELMLTPLLRAPDEVALRAVAAALMAVGGGLYPPRLKRLERLLENLRAEAAGPAARTLAGCRIRSYAGRALIVREIARIEMPEVELEAGRPVVWDGRWRITAGPAALPLTVSPLGASGWAEARERTTRFIPGAARPALLALRRGGKLVGVPHAGWTVEAVSAIPLKPAGIPAASFSETMATPAGGSLGKGDSDPYFTQRENTRLRARSETDRRAPPLR